MRKTTPSRCTPFLILEQFNYVHQSTRPDAIVGVTCRDCVHLVPIQVTSYEIMSRVTSHAATSTTIHDSQSKHPDTQTPHTTHILYINPHLHRVPPINTTY
jgi:hypothetical protein